MFFFSRNNFLYEKIKLSKWSFIVHDAFDENKIDRLTDYFTWDKEHLWKLRTYMYVYILYICIYAWWVQDPAGREQQQLWAAGQLPPARPQHNRPSASWRGAPAASTDGQDVHHPAHDGETDQGHWRDQVPTGQVKPNASWMEALFAVRIRKNFATWIWIRMPKIWQK